MLFPTYENRLTKLCKNCPYFTNNIIVHRSQARIPTFWPLCPFSLGFWSEYSACTACVIIISQRDLFWFPKCYIIKYLMFASKIVLIFIGCGVTVFACLGNRSSCMDWGLWIKWPKCFILPKPRGKNLIYGIFIFKFWVAFHSSYFLEAKCLAVSSTESKIFVGEFYIKPY